MGEIDGLRKNRDKHINTTKLRLTVINRIPCNFVEFHVSYLSVFGSKGVKDDTKKGDEIRITTCKMGEENLRYKVWLIICKV